MDENDVPARDVFAAAKEKFLDSLSSTERARFTPCCSIEEVLQEANKFEKFSKRGSKTTRCLNKIRQLGDSLEPYFKIMEIFCASHPDWANIALGGLLLVFKVSAYLPLQTLLFTNKR